MTDSPFGALHIRPFRPGDDETLVSLWNQTLTRDPISLATFRRQTLLNRNFQPQGCLLAELDGTPPVPAGFVLAMAPRAGGLHAPAAGSGRIVGLGVLPHARRRGLGTALLEQALAFLAESGCRRVGVAAHEYYAAGVDKDAYPDGIAFLTARGFKPTYEAIAMGRQLYDLTWPEEVRAAEVRLRTEGIEVQYFHPAHTYALAEYFRAEFPDWVEFFTRKLDARHDLDEIVIATDSSAPSASSTPSAAANPAAGARVVGYCQHLDTDHVGPFGVAAAYRSRGIGSVMLYRLLDAMRAKGYRFAWFGETGRARPYYERAGFHVTRTYVALARDLTPDTTPTEPAHA